MVRWPTAQLWSHPLSPLLSGLTLPRANVTLTAKVLGAEFRESRPGQRNVKRMVWVRKQYFLINCLRSKACVWTLKPSAILNIEASSSGQAIWCPNTKSPCHRPLIKEGAVKTMFFRIHRWKLWYNEAILCATPNLFQPRLFLQGEYATQWVLNGST